MAAPELQNLDDVLPASQVRESVTETKSEPPAVTLARLKHENTRFLVVAIGALSIGLLTTGMLMYAYPDSEPEAQTRILTVIATLATGAFGTFIGRVSAK